MILKIYIKLYKEDLKMIKAYERVAKAAANYNKKTGEGANELLLALLEYHRKDRELGEALAKVDLILGGRN